MLYYIFRFLDQFGISGSHLWGYISFRAILALIIALVISSWFGEHFIKYLKKKQITETARDENIDPFGVKKIGVPSMGGIILIVAILSNGMTLVGVSSYWKDLVIGAVILISFCITGWRVLQTQKRERKGGSAE